MHEKTSLEGHFFGSATVGERGQIVIPSEARKQCNINPGDKMLVLGHPSGHGIWICKIDAMRDGVTAFLSHIEEMMRTLTEERNGE